MHLVSIHTKALAAWYPDSALAGVSRSNQARVREGNCRLNPRSRSARLAKKRFETDDDATLYSEYLYEVQETTSRCRAKRSGGISITLWSISPFF